ncbi:MAG TPA: Rieske (2Fe-2S) protein [Stellaceae bacterium]|nr:Rieske (2Fe-2S) protein [Stellaceae bacterium]
MPSYFDPLVVEQWGGAFLREDKIEEALRRLIPNAAITAGRYSYPSRAETRDLAWNHMDQNHRPTIHETYGDAARVHIGEHSAFSLTRFGRWPFVIPVFDGRHKENGFYQIILLFGLFVIITIIECNEVHGATQMDIRWFIASHRGLRFLHKPLNRRLTRLNDEQNRADDEIRDRRTALRAQGYSFVTDRPDFLNANIVANDVIFPPLGPAQPILLAELAPEAPVRVELGGRAFILRRRPDGGVDVWPGICLHEGAALAPEHILGRVAKCPWHGLEWGASQLSENTPSVEMCGARLELAAGRIHLRPSARSRAAARTEPAAEQFAQGEDATRRTGNS